jgi:LmbE family N-acetylglucosaminyl deacetylase
LWFHTWIGLQAVVAVCSPHADDSEFLAAVIRWLTDLGVTVYNLLFWPGYRCPGLADVPLDDEEKTVLREKEFEAACIVTRARPQMLRLHGYEHPEADYRAGEDENTITRLFAKLHPRLVILPPFYDSTPHARTREPIAKC